jgi:cytochrome P450
MLALNLADHPDARKAVVAEPALLPDAIEESLRYNTSAQRFRRCLQHDVELHGQTMRAGDFVILAYGSGNRDDRQYPDPDSYDLGRKPRGHLGFGGGVHACLGATVGRMAARIAFEELHQVVPGYQRRDEQLRWMPSSTFRSPLQLVLAAG